MRHLRWVIIALLVNACGPSDSDDEAADEDAVEEEGAADAVERRDAGGNAAAPTGGDTRPSSDASAPETGAAFIRDAASERDARPNSFRRDAGDRDEIRRDDASLGQAPNLSDAGTRCPGHGNVTYSLVRAQAASAEQAAAYMRITRAMDSAVEKYNCYSDLTRALRVEYVPSVATADGNVNGNIRFGSQASMNFVTAMHEIGHTFGVGSNEFKANSSNGRFNGPQATAEIRRITGKADEFVHTDGTHFWPFGLNYENEYESEADAVSHCQMVVAIRRDLGL